MRLFFYFNAMLTLASQRMLWVFAIALLWSWLNPSFAQETPVQKIPKEECTAFNIDPFDIAHKKSSRVDVSAFKALEGKTLRNIRFLQMNVFDENNPEENNRLYKILNKLHIKTRTNVVESQLLFKAGDRINYKIIDETARNLRTRKYLTNAYILPEKVCGADVDIVVITQDAWALEPQVKFSRKSDDNQTGFAISDGNLFGTGNSFSVGYEESELRNTVNYEFSNPYFLNKQIAVRALYGDTSDGRNTLLSVARPFYSLDTPKAAGLKVSDLSQVEQIRSRGVVVNTFLHQAVENEIYIGRATDINPSYTQRWLVGFTQEEDSFFIHEDTLQPIPQRDKAIYPWVEYQYLQNEYGVFKNLNQIQRPEDISIGQTMTIRVGAGGTAFGNTSDVLRYKATYTNIIDLSDTHIFELEMKLDGRQHFGFNQDDPTIFTSSAAYHYLQDEKNRWYARIEYGIGENLPQYQELTVGDITGLRGYPTDYLRGNQRYLFTVERRYFSDIHIFNLLRLGGLVFFDAGKAWGLPHEPNSPLLSNVGIGLRLSSTKVRIGNIIHIDVAKPTATKNGISKYQVTIGAYQKF